jgi:hypothetical protein
MESTVDARAASCRVVPEEASMATPKPWGARVASRRAVRRASMAAAETVGARVASRRVVRSASWNRP